MAKKLGRFKGLVMGVPCVSSDKNVLMISGVPGSGKSTVIVSLDRALKEMGFKVKIVNLTGFHDIVYVFVYVLAFLTYGKPDFHELVKGHIHPITLVSKSILNKFLKILQVLEFFSVNLIFLTKIIIPIRLKRQIIILNEGTINTIGSYIATFYNGSDSKVFWAFTLNILRLTKKISSETSLGVFFLDANNSVLAKRWQSRGYPPQLQPPFTYENYFAYSECLRKAEHLFEQLLNIDVVRLDTASNKPSTIINVILNESGFKH